MMNLKKTLAAFVTATMIALGFVGLAQTAASAAVTPFSCESAFYQTSQSSSKTQLYKLNVATSTYTAVGSQASVAVNGIGYNPQDNFIYGWVGAKLYQIDSTGVFTDTGVSVTGVNPSGADFIGPDIMILTNSTATVQKVVLTRTAGVLSGGTVSTLTTTGNTGTGYSGAKDIAIFKEGTHYMGYAAEGTAFFTFDFGTSNSPTNLTYVNRAVTWSPSVGSSTFGAQYADASGNLYFYNNTASGGINYLYYMSSATRTGTGSITSASVVSSNALSSPNDGASCVTAASPLAPSIGATISVSSVSTGGATLGGTITTNNSAVSTGNLLLCYSTSADVTGGLLSTSVTCVNASPSSAAASSSAQALSNTLSGLSSGTKYYVQYKATNAASLTGWSNVANFTTTSSSVTMTFNKNDGSGTTTTQSYTNGATNALSFSNPWTRTGYTFLGWSTSSSATAADTSYTVSGAATLYAVWQADSYSLTFDKNAGGASTTTSSSYNYGATNALSFSNPWTRTGYTFLGWSTSSSATAADTSYTVSGAATLYAVWSQNPINSFTITYAKNDGSASTQDEALASGDTTALNFSSPWSRTGYTFLGWSTDPSATLADSSYTVSNNDTLYAVWDVNSYTLTYNANDGSGNTQDEAVTYGDSNALNFSSPWSRTGYTFLGWSTSSSATTADGSYTVSANATLYAVWSQVTHKITYDANDSSANSHDVVYAEGDTTALNFSSPWSRTGYTFLGWSTDPSATSADGSYTVSTNDTLYAVWDVNNYNITYKSNDGLSNTDVQNMNYGTTYALDYGGSWTRTGYTFLGWSTDPTSTAADTGYTVTADGDLYAIWQAIGATTHQVTYDKNDGSGLTHNENLTDGDTTALDFSSPWSRTDYTFLGWSTDPNATDPDVSFTVLADATLYAVWSLDIYLITYDANDTTGNTQPESANSGSTNALDYMNPWSRDGYTFEGWSTNPNATSPDGSYTVAGDDTLYAVWSLNSYTVTYDANDGSGSNHDETVNFGDTGALNFANPWTRTGYTFLGWSTDPSATEADASLTVPSDITLYAVWHLISSANHRITYHSADGANLTTQVDYTDGSTGALVYVNSWTRNGYTFVGWSANYGATEADTSYRVWADGDLFAIWAVADPATFGSFPNRTKSITTHSYTLVAPTTNSGGAITYSLDCAQIATLAGNVVTFVAPGLCDITATVAAMPGFGEATITMTLTITPEVKPVVVTPPNSGDPQVTDDGNDVGDITLTHTKPKGKVTLDFTDPSDDTNNWQLILQGTGPTGTPSPLDELNRLVFETGNKVKTQGSGFMPATKVVVCIESTILGTITTDANGSFNATFLIPQSIKRGIRYIQVNGVTNGNTIRTVSLAVVFKAASKLTLSKSVYFVGDSPKLTQKGGDILRAIRAAVKGKKNIVVTVSGWVKETGDKSYDAKLSSARAANMVYVLKSIWHVKATYSYKGYGISPENSAKSRRADIVVTYTK